MTELIQTSHVFKTFNSAHGAVKAVDDLNLRVEAGEIYGLVGADGAGKTTTLRLLCGALHADAGQVRVAGYDVARQAELARAQIGYLSQRFSLYEDLTVIENIRFFAEVRGLTSKEWRPRCLEILEFVGLERFKERFAGQLSGGMRQKLGLASALVTRPQVLLLDEPTTGVDPVTRQDFWQLILNLVSQPEAEKKVAVMVSTPYMDEAARCHRVGFLREGQMVSEGTPSQLRAALKERILEVRGSPQNRLKPIAAQNPAVEDVQAFGDCLHLRVKPGQAAKVMADLHNKKGEGVVVEEVRMIPASLEDVFLALSAGVQNGAYDGN